MLLWEELLGAGSEYSRLLQMTNYLSILRNIIIIYNIPSNILDLKFQLRSNLFNEFV